MRFYSFSQQLKQKQIYLGLLYIFVDNFIGKGEVIWAHTGEDVTLTWTINTDKPSLYMKRYDASPNTDPIVTNLGNSSQILPQYESRVQAYITGDSYHVTLFNIHLADAGKYVCGTGDGSLKNRTIVVFVYGKSFQSICLRFLFVLG